MKPTRPAVTFAHSCDLFGLSLAGAYRYTAVIDRVDTPIAATPRALVTGPEIAMSAR